jgi:hypothetical protein
VVIQVKALACELPFEQGIPLSRFSTRDLTVEAIRRGIVAEISGSTVWRWLDQDAIKPWRYRSWIFPRDPHFEQKAGRVLDLYQGVWQGVALESDEFVLCADEKTRIQARRRRHRSLPPAEGEWMKVEHEYERLGSLNYLAAWDVRHAKLFGRCEAKCGIQAFDRLVSDVMSQPPYCSARRVFWIVDNGSSHRGQPAIDRLQSRWPNLVLVHLPVHASWLNQIEIYFSIVQRKVLTPNDFPSVEILAQTILGFQNRYEQIAKPIDWKFTKKDLSKMMAKLSQQSNPLIRAA